MKVGWLDGAAGADGAAGHPELERVGVVLRHLGTGPDHVQALEHLAQARGYVAQDTVTLSASTPDLEQICARFSAEHLHTEDEVRYVLAGAGIFDIRSADDRWLRVEVEAGDLLVIPAYRQHRFLLTDSHQIHCVRLFKDHRGWEPHYRQV